MGIPELQGEFPFPKDPPPVPASAHGWFETEHERLLGPALGLRTTLIVELGTWLGKSLRFMARKAPNAVLIPIDLWTGKPHQWKMAGFELSPEQFYQTFQKSCWEYKDRLIPLRMETALGLRLVHEHGLKPDLIYVDAGHDYESVRTDLETCDALFPEAALAGDDFPFPGVCQALKERVATGHIKAFAKGNVWWKEHPCFRHMTGVRITS